MAVRVHEMTEVKRNEERLRRSETLMVDTYGVAHLGTWRVDVSQPHAHWSAGALSHQRTDPRDVHAGL